MTEPSPEVAAAMKELARLTAPGVLGFYTHFEVVEIFGYQKGQPPINVLSLLIAVERAGAVSETSKIIGDRIKLKSLKDWTFGIKRTFLPVADLAKVVQTCGETGKWIPSGAPLQVGTLISVPPQFVPPDTTTIAPLNNVLKNNFWSGSYLLEFADPEKLALAPFFSSPERLQDLSASIQKHLPIRIASLSDRLGNIIIQLPVTAIVATFARDRVAGDVIITIHWHNKVQPRLLRASCEMQSDNLVSSFVSANIQSEQTRLPAANGDGMQRGVIWDDQNGVLLALTGLTGFVDTISYDMHLLQPEPRVFLRDDLPVRVPLQLITQNTVGTPRSARDGGWTLKRTYKTEAAQAAEARVFVQYLPVPPQPEASRAKALADIRYLLTIHGKRGAWLWDPFLSAGDILDTLFYCPYMGVELRALTDAQDIPVPASPSAQKSACAIFSECFKERFREFFGLPKKPLPRRPSFAERQLETINSAQSNLLGVNLEYRARIGNDGWAFHDRFLIFPYVDGGALAWSLGTSVNGLGKQHHILQRVEDGQMIADAFDRLWTELSEPKHLIWKTP